VIAEDTRHTRRLLAASGIEKQLHSLPAFAEGRRVAGLLDRLRGGEVLALCSDAGMPAISDPGSLLVGACREDGIPVEVVPGPSAVVAALAGSGIGGGGGFTFLGFLPRSPGKQRRVVAAALGLEQPVVFFESPLRLARTLESLAETCGDRRLAVARELTKVHETFHLGTAVDLARSFRDAPARGECTVVIGA
jgi:16S rRNA (cytidine1402-2'-O)-methyltransferase